MASDSTATVTSAQRNSSCLFARSTPGSSPASHRIWKPLQIPSTGPPSAANARTAPITGARRARVRRSAGSRRTRSRRGGRRHRRLGEPVRRMPDRDGLCAEALERQARVGVVVRAGEGDHGDPGARLAHGSSATISKLSISGLARSSAHIRSTSARGSRRLLQRPPGRRACRSLRSSPRSPGSRAMPGRPRPEDRGSRLRPDQHREPQSTTSGLSRYLSKASPVRSSNAST